MTKPRVFLTRRWPEPAEAALAERFDVTCNEDDRPLSPEQLKAALVDHDALLPTVVDSIDTETLAAVPLRARIIANYGVGVSHINLSAARERGIVVTNTPDVLTSSTAELAITLMLMAARRAGEGERQLRAGAWSGWRPTHLIGRQVTGKTLGVIGMGRIGRAVARRAAAGFDMEVIYFNRHPVSPSDLGRASATIEEVLEQADFLSLHVPGGEENRHLLDEKRLSLMKPGAVLINTSRGEVVNEAALAVALASGKIAAAGLDVYEAEPQVHPGLLQLENVVLLPHLGSATLEARVGMGMRVIANLEAFFAGDDPPDRVA
ncbi:MAG TPA: D-glycerate dehydrogenase [Acidimicrobiia bacterium]|nr:D-glycerate dehydrogenase [Acidimicrobiia bacterium]